MPGETKADVSGWTVDTYAQATEQRIADLRSMLDERYATQTKALDAAFLAQQTAMQTALTAAEAAVQTALTAAEKAVGKAETAAEKRFDSVNEFRAQLADQAQTFMPRQESEASMRSLVDKLDSATSRNSERIREVELQLQGTATLTDRDAVNSASIARYEAIGARLGSLELRINSRLDMREGSSSGQHALWGYLVGSFGIVIAIITIVTTIIISRP
jgi:hypothetical protein